MSITCLARAAALLQGYVQISRQAQHFRKVMYSIDCVAGAALSMVTYRRARHSTFVRSGADFVAGAALSQGRVKFLAGAAFSQSQVT